MTPRLATACLHQKNGVTYFWMLQEEKIGRNRRRSKVVIFLVNTMEIPECGVRDNPLVSLLFWRKGKKQNSKGEI